MGFNVLFCPVPFHLGAWEEPWEGGIHLRTDVSPVFLKKKVVSVKFSSCHSIFYRLGSQLLNNYLSKIILNLLFPVSVSLISCQLHFEVFSSSQRVCKSNAESSSLLSKFP